MSKQVANAVEVTCVQCGKRKMVAPLRARNYICCSVECHAAYNAARGLKEDEFVCGGCGEVFARPENILRAKYCSRRCLGLAKKRKRVQIVCRGCGKTFARPKSHAKIETRVYCPKTCWMESTKRDVLEKNTFNCHNCGKETTFHPPHSVKTKYCSQECAAEAKRTGELRTCPICKNEFYSTSGRRKFCSNPCRVAFAKKNNIPVMPINCEACGKLVYRSVEQIGRTKLSFCSQSCRAKVYFAGENNGRWRGGISSLRKRVRELAESKAWQLDVFKRDNYECQLCAAHGAINAHHAIPFAVLLNIVISNHGFDPSDKSQHDRIVAAARAFKPFWNVNNGITVCDKCHDMIHGLNRRKADGKQIPSATEASSV